MKILILFLIFFIPLSLLAQSKVDEKNTEEVQLMEWMNKISSDSELRNQMVAMMIESTKGNKDEMLKLVNSFTVDSELNKMIVNKMPKRATSEYSLQPREMMGDTVRVMKMESVKPVPKKTD